MKDISIELSVDTTNWELIDNALSEYASIMLREEAREIENSIMEANKEMYIQAIYNITHYPPGLIEDMVTLDGDKPHSHYLHGTMQHDILVIYAAIREYERLTDK